MVTLKNLEYLKIPLVEIQSATNNFGDSNSVGQGGFGKVYKGELSHANGRSTVAVKRLDSTGLQGEHEFLNEIAKLSSCTHKNLVSLLGFCDEGGEKILVYEHLCHGSLDKYLRNNNDVSSLTWIQRLKICIGVACGLDYLHHRVGTQHRIIHRDIKSSNILLDEKWEPKISDFGLSKLGPANQPITFVLSNVAGTWCYVDPLYQKTGRLTKESDVYSFGVVLFEVLCGRLAFVEHYDDERRFLTNLARLSYEKKKLDDIIEPDLRKQMKQDSLDTFSAIAYQCLEEEREKRPSITLVVGELEKALDFQVRCQRREHSSTIEYQPGSLYSRLTLGSQIVGKGESNGNEEMDEYNSFKRTAQLVNGSSGGSIISWQKGDFLGKGPYAAVYEAITSDGFFMAVKEIPLFDLGKDNIYQLEQEISLLSQFKHENLVQYFGQDNDKDNGKLYIFVELVTKGSLERLYKKFQLQDSQVSAYTRQILNGLHYLHESNVIHGNIKCANVLVDANGSVKLTDFALGEILMNKVSRNQAPFWMAPEIFNNPVRMGYENAIDIWSLGCTVLEMLTRQFPYSPLDAPVALSRIEKGELPPIPVSLSLDARSFILECLQVNPKGRPTAAELLKHPFVKRSM